MSSFQILNSEIDDLDFACFLYDEAIKYQRENGYPEYRWDDRAVQADYIKKGLHYKVVIETQIAAIFNIQFSDKNTWREMDKGDSIYLHGVITNPNFKGLKLFGKILDWSIQFAKEKEKSTIRMDTWHGNSNLISYYLDFGFKIVGNYQLPDSEDIPLNCRGNKVVLMELNLTYNETHIRRIVKGFQDKTLVKSEWTHNAHLVVSIWYCTHYDFPICLERLRKNIMEYNTSIGGANTDTGGYHETITQFWLKQTYQFLSDKKENGFIQNCTLFLDSNLADNDSPLRFYSKELLFSIEARRSWVEPDLTFINTIDR